MVFILEHLDKVNRPISSILCFSCSCYSWSFCVFSISFPKVRPHVTTILFMKSVDVLVDDTSKRESCSLHVRLLECSSRGGFCLYIPLQDDRMTAQLHSIEQENNREWLVNIWGTHLDVTHCIWANSKWLNSIVCLLWTCSRGLAL